MEKEQTNNEQDIQERMGHDASNTWTAALRLEEKGYDCVVYPAQDKVEAKDFMPFITPKDAQDYLLDNNSAEHPLALSTLQEINDALAPLVRQELDRNIEEREHIQQNMDQDAINIFADLIHQQQNGHQWVAYPDVAQINMEDTRTFPTKGEAEQYIVDHGQDEYNYRVNSITDIIDAIKPVVQEQLDQIFHVDRPELDKDMSREKKGRDEEMEM